MLRNIATRAMVAEIMNIGGSTEITDSTMIRRSIAVEGSEIAEMGST